MNLSVREIEALNSKELSPLAEAATVLILTNGGIVSAEDTIDGEEYVMVLLDAFKALEKVLTQP